MPRPACSQPCCCWRCRAPWPAARRSKARDFTNLTAPGLYHQARKSLEDNDYESAVKQYEALTTHFPFSDETRQARLDLICVYYRKGEKETATDAAEQFLRENPTHPRVDYAWYMKGLIDYEEQPWKIERWLGVDPAKKPPASLNSAITAFSTVVKQYPKSEYAHDSQLRTDLPAQPAGRIRDERRPLLRASAAPTSRPRTARCA